MTVSDVLEAYEHSISRSAVVRAIKQGRLYAEKPAGKYWIPAWAFKRFQEQARSRASSERLSSDKPGIVYSSSEGRSLDAQDLETARLLVEGEGKCPSKG